MLSLEEAQSRVLAQIKFLGTEWVPLTEAEGRFLAQAAEAKIDLPRFDNSAMDGYAVHSEDLKGASTDSPVVLAVTGKIAAGKSADGLRLSPGSCVRVFTGSPLPTGADAVLMQEDARTVSSDSIACLDSTRPFEHIRLKGEDVRKGSILTQAGQKLNVASLSVCAAAGISSLNCARKPKVGLLATGNELVEPGLPLREAQIYESNRLALGLLARKAGAKVQVYPIVRDSVDETRISLQQAFSECDYVVTSGGVSVGELDFVKPAFEACGGILHFWRVSIKPGKPFVYGTLGDKILFGLPGNPVSAFVTFLLLVRPALLKAQGASDTALSSIKGCAGERFANRGDRRHFLRVRMTEDQRIFSAGTQASHMLSSLAQATGLIDLAPDSSVEPGSPLSMLLWD